MLNKMKMKALEEVLALEEEFIPVQLLIHMPRGAF